MSGKALRKLIIQDLRQAGAQAYDAKRSLGSNPCRGCDEIHWAEGWIARKREVEPEPEESYTAKQIREALESCGFDRTSTDSVLFELENP